MGDEEDGALKQSIWSSTIQSLECPNGWLARQVIHLAQRQEPEPAIRVVHTAGECVELRIRIQTKFRESLFDHLFDSPTIRSLECVLTRLKRLHVFI